MISATADPVSKMELHTLLNAVGKPQNSKGPNLGTEDWSSMVNAVNL